MYNKCKYEVVWTDKNKLYRWESPEYDSSNQIQSIPEDVHHIFFIVASAGKTAMVYKLKESSSCVEHSSIYGFGDEEEWLKKASKKLKRNK